MATPRIVLTLHAWQQLRRRSIPEDIAARVASRPEQIVPVWPGREVRQSIVPFGAEAKRYLVRAVVDVTGRDIEIITVYRTTKVAKYWRAP